MSGTATQSALNGFWQGLAASWPVLVGMVVFALWLGRLEQRVLYNAAEDIEHHNDPTLHMPYADKVKAFVTREEFREFLTSTNDQLRGIDERQREIKSAIDRLEAASGR